MTMPGFTADRSLYRSHGHYVASGWYGGGGGNEVGLAASGLGVGLAAGQMSEICDVTCENSSSVVHILDVTGKCVPSITLPCAPYGCDPGTQRCRSSCGSSADCASGCGCDLATAECATMPNSCKDNYTLRAADGTLTTCEPYTCNAGSCMQTCSGEADCAPGYHCDGVHCLQSVVPPTVTSPMRVAPSAGALRTPAPRLIR